MASLQLHLFFVHENGAESPWDFISILSIAQVKGLSTVLGTCTNSGED